MFSGRARKRSWLCSQEMSSAAIEQFRQSFAYRRSKSITYVCIQSSSLHDPLFSSISRMCRRPWYSAYFSVQLNWSSRAPFCFRWSSSSAQRRASIRWPSFLSMVKWCSPKQDASVNQSSTDLWMTWRQPSRIGRSEDTLLIASSTFRLASGELALGPNSLKTKSTGMGSLEAITAQRRFKKSSSLTPSSFVRSFSSRLK